MEIKGKLNLACSNGYLRTPLEYIWFLDGFIYASDGTICVRQSYDYIRLSPREIECVEGRGVHKDIWSLLLAKKGRYEVLSITMCKENIDVEYRAFGNVSVPYAPKYIPGSTTAELKAMNFKSVWPTKVKEVKEIGISLGILSKLKGCMHTEGGYPTGVGNKFIFYGVDQPILIHNTDDEIKDQCALIMPILLNDFEV